MFYGTVRFCICSRNKFAFFLFQFVADKERNFCSSAKAFKSEKFRNKFISRAIALDGRSESR